MSSRALLEGSDSESDGEGKNEDDTDSNMPSKNFAILLVEKFIYEDSDKNFYLEEALKHKGEILFTLKITLKMNNNSILYRSYIISLFIFLIRFRVDAIR